MDALPGCQPRNRRGDRYRAPRAGTEWHRGHPQHALPRVRSASQLGRRSSSSRVATSTWPPPTSRTRCSACLGRICRTTPSAPMVVRKADANTYGPSCGSSVKRARATIARRSDGSSPTAWCRRRSSCCPAWRRRCIGGERRYAMRVWLDPASHGGAPAWTRSGRAAAPSSGEQPPASGRADRVEASRKFTIERRRAILSDQRAGLRARS